APVPDPDHVVVVVGDEEASLRVAEELAEDQREGRGDRRPVGRRPEPDPGCAGGQAARWIDAVEGVLAGDTFVVPVDPAVRTYRDRARGVHHGLLGGKTGRDRHPRLAG